MARASSAAILVLFPMVLRALRLREGANFSMDLDMDLDMSNASEGSTLGGSDHTNHTNSEWPDHWVKAVEHGHFIAHLLDQATLHNFTHPRTNRSRPHYDIETAAIPQFQVPAMKMQHAVPGWNTRSQDEEERVTNFPSYLALASSWDKNLVYDVAMAVSEEFKTLGANVMLGPAINIHRSTQHDEEFDSLSGEDPTLGSVLVRSWILATQTHGIMSVPKHLGRAEQSPIHFENSSANVTSWDIFYPPFETAVDCGAAGIMCASHEVNGLWSCRDKEMLDRDLKHIMGFRGMVIADNNTARDYFAYASSFEKGLDMEADEPDVIPSSLHSVEGERKAAGRALAALWHMRLEQHPGCTPPACEEDLQRIATTTDHFQLSMVAAGSAITLLKNTDDVLPLQLSSTVKRIGVFGPASTKAWHNDDFESPFHAIVANGADRGSDDFESPFHAIVANGADRGFDVVDVYEETDVCLVMVSSGSSAAHWSLDDESTAAILEAVERCQKIVVFMEISGAVLMNWRNQVHAIASVFHAGVETSFGWVTTLFGDSSPSGKLPITFPDYDEDVPEWWTEGAPSYWAGSRATYHFGHGLSYAKFRYSNFIEKKGCRFTLCVMVTVTNDSPVHSGAEVVQVYFKPPPELAHPTVLRGFHKTRVLGPGDKEKVFFHFNFRDVTLYHDIDHHAEAERSWTPMDTVEVLVGSSSVDLRHSLTLHPRY